MYGVQCVCGVCGVCVGGVWCAVCAVCVVCVWCVCGVRCLCGVCMLCVCVCVYGVCGVWCVWCTARGKERRLISWQVFNTFLSISVQHVIFIDGVRLDTVGRNVIMVRLCM